MVVVSDIRIPEACRAELERRGFSCVSLPPFSALDPRVASHPDMLILPIDGRLFVHKDYYAEARETVDSILRFASLRLVLTDDKVSEQYPYDVSLNLVVSGNRIIGRQDTMSKTVAAYAEREDLTVVNVKQGYAKCSTVVLGDKALITADPAIEKAARALSLDVLRITPGHVSLRGYDCGFIGGASGVFHDTVFFCGNILSHPDGKAIVNFCSKHAFQVVSLSEESLYDVGTLFFFS